MARKKETEPSPLPLNYPAIRRKLLSWFKKSGRSYPWRQTHNWFHLLMAEMMLRRTRADQVLPVYSRFTARFSSAREAAELSEEEFENLLQPLGLSWRSRQMVATIEYICKTYHTRHPAPGDELREIPGVGEYANAMLRNRLFNERVPAIDTNVARFLLRLAGRPFGPESRRKKELIITANRFVSSPHAADLNLAMIDFSALVCKPLTPLCPECPLRHLCLSSDASK